MNTILIYAGMAIFIIFGIFMIIYFINKVAEDFGFSSFATALLAGIPIILVILIVVIGCLGLYSLKNDNDYDKVKNPSYSEGYIASGKLISSNELLPFEDGSYVQKSEENPDEYYIRVYINDNGDFVEQTIEGELTYSYTTDKPHIEKYLSKEKTIISGEEYSYKVCIPKTEESTETSQSTNNTETTTDNAVENNN